ncbi:MAG: HlyC/CorC family transporter [Rickettsiales bacterium]
MNAEFYYLSAAIFALTLASAFFSAAETALTSASRAQLHGLSRAKNKSAVIAERLLGHKDRLIGTVLLGNNLVNILSSALATKASIEYFGDDGVFVATAVMTVVIIIFAEILPKTYAINHAETVSLTTARVMEIIVISLTPFVAATQWIIRGIFFLCRIEYKKDTTLTAADLHGFIALSHHQGGMARGERDMLASILELEERSVESAMAPRRDIVSVDVDAPAEQICAAVLDGPYTRIPLWRDNPENIIGILHAKHLLAEIRRKNNKADDVDFAAISRAPWFVPETNSLRRQLMEFRKRREHMALVVDEYGDLVGLVTLEDILEEIVGQIRDETDDMETDSIIRVADAMIEAEGDASIHEINKRMDWSVSDDYANTLGGLVMHYTEAAPAEGQRCEADGYVFTVLEVRGNLIARVRIEKKSETDDSETYA